MTVLCVMHVYWLFLFLGIIVNGVRTGTEEDGSRAALKKKEVTKLS